MKNLENYGVQQLNAKEIRETEGGIFPLIFAAASIVAGAAVLIHEYMHSDDPPCATPEQTSCPFDLRITPIKTTL